jgi:hypothetical protein
MSAPAGHVIRIEGYPMPLTLQDWLGIAGNCLLADGRRVMWRIRLGRDVGY